jgi:hypothetical protein
MRSEALTTDKESITLSTFMLFHSSYPSVARKSNWGLLQSAGSSRMTSDLLDKAGVRKSKALPLMSQTPCTFSCSILQ